MTVGVFDSGAGGLLTLSYLRALMPHIDVCFLSDRKNSPYGNKDEETLIRLVGENVEILKSHGAGVILMACCTASTLYQRLNEEYRSITVPIIDPIAREAQKSTKNRRVAVIATEATVRKKAFSGAIKALDPSICVKEFAAQELVELVENKSHDIKKIKEVLEPLKSEDVDTIVLGCTHFPALRAEISELFPGITLINSALIGAIEISKKVIDKGDGKTVFLEK